MPTPITGLHHVTAICGPAQQNIDFYAGVLGLHLVKRTVNFDDPHTYHFYFGDAEGRPGTIMTFFPWEHALQGKPGRGMVASTAFAVPTDGVERWMERLADLAVDFDAPVERFGRRRLPLRAPDGLHIELVEDEHVEEREKDRLSGTIAGVTIGSSRPEHTAGFLTSEFGFESDGEEDGYVRVKAPGAAPASAIEITTRDTPGRMSTGVVHHVAFRASDEAEQLEWRERLIELGFNVSDVRDRQYFKSIYFREPGGVLFEIATDSPGFTVDEMPDRLGSTLKLPPWLEPRRPEIEQRLPPIKLPAQ